MDLPGTPGNGWTRDQVREQGCLLLIAGTPCSKPCSPQPAVPLLQALFSSPPLLRLLAGLGSGQTLSGRWPQSPQHGGRSRRLRLGLRQRQQQPPPPARPRAGAPVCALWSAGLEGGSEGEPRVGVVGRAHTARQPRESRLPERLPRAQGSSSAAQGDYCARLPLALQSGGSLSEVGSGGGAPLRRISPEQRGGSYVSPPKGQVPSILEPPHLSPAKNGVQKHRYGRMQILCELVPFAPPSSPSKHFSR